MVLGVNLGFSRILILLANLLLLVDETASGMLKHKRLLDPSEAREEKRMSLKPELIGPIPEETARLAKAVFPEGCTFIKMRDDAADAV